MSETKNTPNSVLSAVLNQYKGLSEKKPAQSAAMKTDLTNYFNPTALLPKGVTQKDVTIRILPQHAGEDSPFAVVKFHSLKVGGSWRKLYDPEQEGKVSPLNDMQRILLSSGDKEDRRNSVTYKSSPYYICRVIQRDKEHEGIKYFRFRSTDNGSGFMDKIVPYIQRNYDLFDPQNGHDITLTLRRDPVKPDTVRITAVMVEANGPLSNDPVQTEQWLADETTWENVFKKYSTDYLEIIAKGSEPAWDKDKQGYVPKEELEAKLNSAGSSNLIDEDYSTPASNRVEEVDEEVDSIVSPATGPAGSITDDDLPF